MYPLPSDPSNAGPDYWEHEPEPFYTEALPCESCGKPCDSRVPASWDPELLVGKCCEIDLSDQAPLEPVCLELARCLSRVRTVGEVVAAFRLHETSCRLCNPQRRGVELEAPIRQERAA